MTMYSPFIFWCSLFPCLCVALMVEIAADMGNVVFAPSDGLTAKDDGVHFNAASARELGRRFAEAYHRLRNGQQD